MPLSLIPKAVSAKPTAPSSDGVTLSSAFLVLVLGDVGSCFPGGHSASLSFVRRPGAAAFGRGGLGFDVVVFCHVAPTTQIVVKQPGVGSGIGWATTFDDNQFFASTSHLDQTGRFHPRCTLMKDGPEIDRSTAYHLGIEPGTP